MRVGVEERGVYGDRIFRILPVSGLASVLQREQLQELNGRLAHGHLGADALEGQDEERWRKGIERESKG